MGEWKSLWKMMIRMVIGVKNIIAGSLRIRKMKKKLKRRGLK